MRPSLAAVVRLAPPFEGDESLTSEVVAARLNISPANVYARMSRAVKAGLLVRIAPGEYRLPPKVTP